MQQFETFTHYGQAFTIEAEAWPSEDAAAAAMIELQSWVLQLDHVAAEVLHSALEQEREALIEERPYSGESSPLRAVREAQRRAVRAGLQGKSAKGCCRRLA